MANMEIYVVLSLRQTFSVGCLHTATAGVPYAYAVLVP